MMRDFEICCKRFPIVGQVVLNNLKDQCLVRSKETNRGINNFLENERFYWIRILKKYSGNFTGFEESWNHVIKNAPIAIIQQLALAVQDFFQTKSKLKINKVSPFLIAVAKGKLELCEYVLFTKNQLIDDINTAYECDCCTMVRSMKKLDVNNHIRQYHRSQMQFQTSMKLVKAYTPICIALIYGNLDAFKLILENIENKNLTNNQRETLLHLAARYGLLDFCKLIIKYVENKNVANYRGETPLHLAAMYGHLDVCKLIIENIEDKSPADNSEETPLHSAARKGHLDVCKLIIKYVENKNPADNSGVTPLHMAAAYCHLDVCKLIIEYVENKNPATNLGVTPLHLAYGHHSALIKIFKNV